MKRQLVMLVCCIQLLALLLSLCCCSMNTIITSNKQTETIEDCNYDEITDKVEIVFRDADESLKKYGYSDIYSIPNSLSKHIPYEKLAGKKGKVIELIKSRNGISSFFKILVENCEVVYAYTINNSEHDINGTYTLTEFEKANKMISSYIWINQNAWKVRKQELVTDNRNISFPLGHLEKVEVIGVYTKALGYTYGLKPFFLIVRKDSGEEGYVGYNNSFFFSFNPIDESWDAKIVESIKQQSLELGMTKEQIQLAWGLPDDKSRSVGSWGVHEQWIYNETYLNIENGVLTSYQD